MLGDGVSHQASRHGPAVGRGSIRTSCPETKCLDAESSSSTEAAAGRLVQWDRRPTQAVPVRVPAELSGHVVLPAVDDLDSLQRCCGGSDTGFADVRSACHLRSTTERRSKPLFNPLTRTNPCAFMVRAASAEPTVPYLWHLEPSPSFKPYSTRDLARFWCLCRPETLIAEILFHDHERRVFTTSPDTLAHTPSAHRLLKQPVRKPYAHVTVAYYTLALPFVYAGPSLASSSMV